MELIKIGFAENKSLTISIGVTVVVGCLLLDAGKYVGVYAHHATFNGDFLFERLWTPEH